MSTDDSLNPEQFFNDVTKALRQGDGDKLRELTTPPVETPPKEEGKAAEEPKKAEVPPAEPVVKEPTEKTPPVETQPIKAQEPKVVTGEEGKQKPFDWIDSLPDESAKEQARTLLARYKQSEADRRVARQAYKSNAGRIAAYQRTIAELKANLSARPQIDIAASNATDEDFQALVENDPRLAAYLQKQRKEDNERFEQRLAAVVQPLVKSQEQQAEAEYTDFVQEQNAILKQHVPNLDEIVQHPLFKKWANEETTPEEKAEINSPHWEAGYNALVKYDHWLVMNGYRKPDNFAPTQEPVKAATPPPVNTPAEPTVDPLADKVAETRNRKSASTPASSSTTSIPVNVKGDVVDPEAMFKKYYNEFVKQNSPNRR